MKKIIAANWKMNMTAREAASFMDVLNLEMKPDNAVDVVIIPPFTAVPAVSELVSSQSRVALGAQNMHWESNGAYTGEVSAAMLKEFYVHWVVIGHSERRQYFCETDETVNKKVKAAHASLIRPIICIGESLEERDGGKVEEVLDRQLRQGLADVEADKMTDSVLAYEPVWAIGTGRTASPDQAQEAHAFIRKTLADIFDEDTANRVRIQYGGSVKPDNTKDLMSQPDVDGALVGGASLDARSFAKIINEAAALE
jgi:triosephosphate isomerase